MPEWTKPFEKYRELFNGCALVAQHRDGTREFWKVVFAIQRPKAYLALCQLHPVPAPSEFDLAAQLQPLDLSFVFSINYADCRSAADVVVGAKDQLFHFVSGASRGRYSCDLGHGSIAT